MAMLMVTMAIITIIETLKPTSFLILKYGFRQKGKLFAEAFVLRLDFWDQPAQFDASFIEIGSLFSGEYANSILSRQAKMRFAVHNFYVMDFSR